MTKALEDIAAERDRQIKTERWTPKHDDMHSREELAIAAACYALGTAGVYDHRSDRVAMLWPWGPKRWKPSDNRRRDLVKAGALIVAEIERLDRVA
jgi:hypothetical protein